jgi:hypothetical protein
MFLAPTTVDAAMMAVPVIITSVEFTEISSIRHRRQTLAGIAALSDSAEYCSKSKSNESASPDRSH